MGTKPVGGCIGCGGCAKGSGCVFGGVVNEVIEKAKTADGFVFGTPVHYASASGNMTSFLDRLAYAGGKYLAYKPAAICCSARRAGTTATLDQLAKYPEFFHMPLVSGSYWPMVHGSAPEQVLQDQEGCAVMRELGRNMAWLLHCMDALFIAVFKWGVAGAAIATGLSQCVGGVLPLVYFLRPNSSLLQLTKTKLELRPI